MVLIGCSSPTASFLIPDDAVEFRGLEIYDAWWEEVETDVGVSASMERLRFFSVEVSGRGWYNQRYRRFVNGLWVPDGRIYLAEGWEDDEGLVKHEFLHEILRGDRNHSHRLFEAYHTCLTRYQMEEEICDQVSGL